MNAMSPRRFQSREMAGPERRKESLPQKRQTRHPAGLKVGVACVFLLATTVL